MTKRDRTSFWETSLALSTVSLTCLFTYPVSAQITPDNSLGSESSIVNRDVTVKDAVSDLIKGGAIRENNLFHSFSEFNVSDGGRVYFANPDGIANILTRVTGNNLSKIFGTLGVDGAANLFLLNPNGIIFGENASLDVNSSFLATTADSFVFNNGFEYSATNPSAPPLLTVNIPVGLQFGNKAEAIEVRGTGHNISFNPETSLPTWDTREKGLELDSGKTLALVGGEINFEGGNLTAPQGRIELAGITENSNVSLISADNGFSLDSQENTNFKDINLTQAASLDTSGNGSGNLQLQGNNISLLNGSTIITRTIGDENGREVKIHASDSINIVGTNAEFFPSSIVDEVATGATGNGGNLTINADNLKLKEGSQIVSETYGAGNNGDLSVSANNIEVLGVSPYTPSNISNDTYGTGKSGNLTIDTDNLKIKEGGQIGAVTRNGGDGGNVFIKATNMEISGGIFRSNGFFYPSGIFTSVLSLQPGSNDSNLTGNGGNLTINAQELIIGDRGIITSYTKGGNAGNIDINVQKLKLDGDFARISTETRGSGNGGDLIVRAAESVEINGTAVLPHPKDPNQFYLFSNGLSFCEREDPRLPRSGGDGMEANS
jgi:filamentous hemagglutinin family protein